MSNKIEKEIARLIRIKKLLKLKENSLLDDFKPVIPFKGFTALKDRITDDLMFQINHISYTNEFKKLDNKGRIKLFNDKISRLINVIDDLQKDFRFYDIEEAVSIEQDMKEVSFSKLMYYKFPEIKELFTLTLPKTMLQESANTTFFEMLNGLREVNDYIMAMDTLENGISENLAFDKIVKNELELNGFAMAKGYPQDLLVHDRNTLNNPNIIFKSDDSIKKFYLNVETNHINTYSTNFFVNKNIKNEGIKVMPSEQNIQNALEKRALLKEQEKEDLEFNETSYLKDNEFEM